MKTTSAESRVELSPRLGSLLARVTETPDLETALWKVLSEYIDLKTARIEETIEAFEKKWGMPFDEFAARCEEDTLDEDPYSYDVESDYWEWEAAETLLDHYKSLQP